MLACATSTDTAWAPLAPVSADPYIRASLRSEREHGTTDPRLRARMLIAMQQVQLAHWVESGMAEPPAAVVERIAADVTRFLGGGPS